MRHIPLIQSLSKKLTIHQSAYTAEPRNGRTKKKDPHSHHLLRHPYFCGAICIFVALDLSV